MDHISYVIKTPSFGALFALRAHLYNVGFFILPSISPKKGDIDYIEKRSRELRLSGSSGQAVRKPNTHMNRKKQAQQSMKIFKFQRLRGMTKEKRRCRMAYVYGTPRAKSGCLSPGRKRLLPTIRSGWPTPLSTVWRWTNWGLPMQFPQARDGQPRHASQIVPVWLPQYRNELILIIHKRSIHNFRYKKMQISS